MSEEFEKAVMKRFDDMDKKMDNMNNKIDEMDECLNNKIDEIDERLNNKIDEMDERLNNRIDDMGKTLVQLEYKVTTEFPALYEAHSLNYEIQKENEEKLKTMADTASRHSIQIAHLYETVGNHENQLKKLTS